MGERPIKSRWLGCLTLSRLRGIIIDRCAWQHRVSESCLDPLPKVESAAPRLQRFRSRSILVALLGYHSALQQGAVASREFDSAGVRIVRYKATDKPTVRFWLSVKPSFEVGGLEASDVEFNHRQGYLNGARLSSGGYAVIDGDRVHYFNRNSQRVRIVGRRGQGPQEFRNLTSLCRTRGDTLVVNDGGNGRFAVLDGTGKVVRTFPQLGMRSFPANFCFQDGSLVLRQNTTRGVTREPIIRLVRINLTGAILNTIGEVSSRPADMVTQSTPFVATVGDKLYYGDGFAGHVVVFTATGTAIRTIRNADARSPITEADVQRRLGSLIDNRATGKAALAETRANAPSVWPAFERLFVAPDGTLWIQDYRPKLDVRDMWTALDTAGRVIGRLDMSAPRVTMFREIQGFGSKEVFFREYDSDGAVHLRVLPFERIQTR